MANSARRRIDNQGRMFIPMNVEGGHLVHFVSVYHLLLAYLSGQQSCYYSLPWRKGIGGVIRGTSSQTQEVFKDSQKVKNDKNDPLHVEGEGLG